ncbi:MAG TPA: 16S rRNA (guanine(966)-N(2))-methyltransferase RsmD [Steroidobacteraceae bacterium]
MTLRKLDRTRPAGLNSVRIIGGSWRGRRVRFPDSPGLRPTPDRVRETLFNWLQHSIAGARCLDLFAGSGALGLEALSRGAREVVFVEQAFAPAATLAEELKRFEGGDLGGSRGRIAQMSAERFLGAPGEPFDVIFLDPPFGLDALPEYVRLIDAGGWVASGGWIYLESARSTGPPAMPPRWNLLKSKSAGEVGYHLARANVEIHHE